MTTTHDDNATTWRDLTDQLTNDQIGHLENFEAKALAEPAEVAEGLLEWAREHAQKNLADDAQFGHLPHPAGARRADHWEDDGEGNWSRMFAGSQRFIESPCISTPVTGDRTNIGLDIEGQQHADGTVVRYVYLSGGGELTAISARQLAAALIEAADEVERLNA
jgi:hypothetical protein